MDRSQEVMMVFIMDYFSIIHFKDPANGYFSLLINLITKLLKQLVENCENCFHPTISNVVFCPKPKDIGSQGRKGTSKYLRNLINYQNS